MPALQSYLRPRPPGSQLEERLEPIMLGLSLMFVLVFSIPAITEVSAEAEVGLGQAGWLIWIAFVVEYLVLLALSPDRAEWVRNHKLDLVIIALPFLRALRFVRFVRVATASSGIGRAILSLQRMGARPGLQPAFLALCSFIVVGAGFALAFEHEQPGSSIDSIGTALWWAVVTCSTVGYGDQFPVTNGGRVIAVALMLVGIGGMTLLTATIAAYFVDQDDDVAEESLRAQLNRIEALLIEQQSD